MQVTKAGVLALISMMVLLLGRPCAADRVYTLDADFDEGNLVDVNHDSPNNNQLQLNTSGTSFVFVNVAASGRGTIVKIDADTGIILAEYKTAPEGRGLNPSRTSADIFGNVWTANRDEVGEINGVPSGSAVKIGQIIGGNRVTVDVTGDITPDPNGQYLEPPFEYNTCIDRDEDGLIKTSQGLGNILPWPDVTDGVGGDDGIVEDAEDECILLYQRLADAVAAHHVSVDTENNVWVGGYPFAPTIFYKLNGDTAAVMDSFDADEIGCGGFGGLVDGNGILWSADPAESQLMYFDPDPDIRSGGCVSITESFGLGIDSNGFIWNTLFSPSQIAKVDPDPSGPSIVAGFPKDSDDAFFAPQGVAVTPTDNNVWVANSGDDEILRLDNNGNFQTSIGVGDIPSGVAVDANGKVWVANVGSDNVMRIGPDPGDDGLVEVELTVDLGTSADPENYSDMASNVTNIETSPQGAWTVIYDGGVVGNSWGTITWNTEPEASEPDGTSIIVGVRAADSEEDLETEDYLEVLNGEPFDLGGQFIQIRTTFQANDDGAGPILSDLAVFAQDLPQREVCDVDGDGVIDYRDIKGIYYSLGETADGPDDPRDWNRDGMITKIDAKGCIRECTDPHCGFYDSERPCNSEEHLGSNKSWKSNRHWKSRRHWKSTNRRDPAEHQGDHVNHKTEWN